VALLACLGLEKLVLQPRIATSKAEKEVPNLLCIYLPLQLQERQPLPEKLLIQGRFEKSPVFTFLIFSGF
jgi:hypothetical protein